MSPHCSCLVTHRIRSGFRAHGLSNSPRSKRQPANLLPVTNQPSANPPANNDQQPRDTPSRAFNSSSGSDGVVVDNTNAAVPSAPEASTEAEGEGPVLETPKKKNVASRFYHTGKDIILSSYINLLLVFVPAGIAAEAAGLNPSVIFALNAVAIVPLAGLLSHATESVAKRMGDTVGALMNVTFGNAVELIILIALVKNEIRIVQASLLGSILANLLLILGMCFLVGGLRYREQIYNSTVTQMSACLLSLSVMSLLLPTAFHASFTNTTDADNKVLKVSRGTSVVLLVVYGMYLLFQLKSHAYMYQSTPQNLIDEELAPGPVAAWLDSSSSSSGSSSDSDSDATSGSVTTAKRIKRVMRGGRRRRKSSSASKDTVELVRTRGSSFANGSGRSPASNSINDDTEISPRLDNINDNGEDADNEADQKKASRADRPANSRQNSGGKKEKKSKKKRRHRKDKQNESIPNLQIGEALQSPSSMEKQPVDENEPRRVDFAIANETEAQNSDSPSKRPFTLRGLRPALPKGLSQTVFSSPGASPALHGIMNPPSGPIPRVRYGIRRTNSLPDRLNQTSTVPSRVQSNVVQPPAANSSAIPKDEDPEDENISRTTAVMLLLISTALVAVCAEFMVDSINAVVNTPGAAVSEAFIGLIILPIVGNAAEHVTAVTVASKNKMDLAIGVAVGSSIQIALFVTPFVVLLGWCMNKDMSLYFTLFETVSLFVSAFIVNFLVLDGRSNYLEGALLCAAYVIIAVAAFFYPSAADASTLGGSASAMVVKF